MKLLFTLGALLGAASFALGAFGAHGLSGKLPPERLQIFETGVRYHFYHVLALLLVGVLASQSPSVALHWSARLFVLGIVFFPGPSTCWPPATFSALQAGAKSWGPSPRWADYYSLPAGSASLFIS